MESFMNQNHRTAKEEIIDHIHAIFRAFIARDREAIKTAHSNDWVGFLGPSTAIERGIDAYMANADKSLTSFTGVGFDLLDTEVQIHGDVAVVYYVARYDYSDQNNSLHSLPLRSVDIYQRRNGDWIQIGSHISVIPSSGTWGEGSSKE
jgi:ketosteroid isomerase-like protein